MIWVEMCSVAEVDTQERVKRVHVIDDNIFLPCASLFSLSIFSVLVVAL